MNPDHSLECILGISRIFRSEALKEYVRSLPTEDQKNIKECYKLTGNMAAEKLGQEMSSECKEELKKYWKKWEEIYEF
ncbi:hypothetical protein TNCV_4735731 [Trichonephila clavipes]|nr:hypothetical protein TNCV_4735731 [Trichonephila clavipes]